MDNYFKLFDSNRKKKGYELYNNNSVNYVIKYNNIYYSKVLGQHENYYSIKIDNNLICSCEDSMLCKHIYSTLLSINDNKYIEIDFDDLSKEKLLELINYCIKKDSLILSNIKDFINKQKQIKSISLNNTIEYKKEDKIYLEDIKVFFENFESDDFDLISDCEYEYVEDTFNDYDNELIDILRNITSKDNKIYSYVLDKINYYNKDFDDKELTRIFTKTLKYIKDPDSYYTNNDIVKLFEKDYDKAIIEFNKINDLKDILFVYKNIKNIDKISLLINKIDNYLSLKNYYVKECLELIIKTSKDEKIIKQYGLIMIENYFNIHIYNIIKPLCNEIELDKILNIIINLDYINDDIFNILYENKLFKIIYNLIKKKSYNNNEIIKYIRLIIKDIPEEINILIKNYIENILNGKCYNYYDDAIEYLKIFKNNNSSDEFIQYTNNLIVMHKKKLKFIKLFQNEFKK